MRRLLPFALIALAVFGMMFLAPSSGLAANWSFTKIADTNTPIPTSIPIIVNFEVFSAPSLDGGKVAFYGDGFSGIIHGIYTDVGGPLTTVVDQSTPNPGGVGGFASLGPPSFDGGKVAFRGYEYGAGIYTNAGGTLALVADTNTYIPGGSLGKFTTFSGLPSLGGGDVAFHGYGPSVWEGIYSNVGGTLHAVADQNTGIPGGTGNFGSFSEPSQDGGRVAFRGSVFGQQGIYTDVGGTLHAVADLGTLIPGGTGNFLVGFGHPSLEGGKVAFYGVGSGGQVGIYTDLSGALAVLADGSTAIPDGTGNFTAFGGVSLDGVNVAFRGVGLGGQIGLYTDIGGLLMKVIDLTDLLDGKSLSDLIFSPEGLSGNSIAFLAMFSDGSQGIFRADPIPEPATLLLLSTGLAGLGLVRRRRRIV